ncbi:MAG: DUF3034 family protein [Planctomycetota bacterium]|nr:DUF3034 family protein [Planctomycetota bacterium]
MNKLLAAGLAVVVICAVSAPVSAVQDRSSESHQWLASSDNDQNSPSGLGAPAGSWLAAAEAEADNAAATVPDNTTPAGDGPPLPLHTIEGVGGGLIVPMAYLVNPGPAGTVIGRPAVSVTYLHMGRKNLLSFAISQTFFRRVELSYAFNRLALGSLPEAIKKYSSGSLKIRRHEVYLHHFNVRGLLIEENSFGMPIPAIVAGMQMKFNGGFRGIDNSLGSPSSSGTFTTIGLDRCNGIDYTLHASKTFPELLFGRPVIFTVGMRNSQASNIGYTGFGGDCEWTIETDVVCLVTDRLAVGYEYRNKNDAYDRPSGAAYRRLVRGEDDWHAVRVAYVINDHCTIGAGWAYLGPVLNSHEGCVWGFQFKYEF